MNSPTDFQMWLDQQAWPFVIIACLIAFTYLALRYSARQRQKTMMRERSGVTEETFTSYLSQFGFDPTITSSTYRYLQEVQRVNFPILPGDMLDEDLGLGQEDVEQSVRELAQALRRDFSPGLAHAPLVSVEDLVRLLQACPRITRSHAA